MYNYKKVDENTWLLKLYIDILLLNLKKKQQKIY